MNYKRYKESEIDALFGFVTMLHRANVFILNKKEDHTDFQPG